MKSTMKLNQLRELLENNCINEDQVVLTDGTEVISPEDYEDIKDRLHAGSISEIIENVRTTVLDFNLAADGQLTVTAEIVTCKTYDVQFNDDTNSSSKGFEISFDDCVNYIQCGNTGINKGSYFEDYKGGTVSVVCNEDPNDDAAYSEIIK